MPLSRLYENNWTIQKAVLNLPHDPHQSCSCSSPDLCSPLLLLLLLLLLSCLVVTLAVKCWHLPSFWLKKREKRANLSHVWAQIKSNCQGGGGGGEIEGLRPKCAFSPGNQECRKYCRNHVSLCVCVCVCVWLMYFLLKLNSRYKWAYNAHTPRGHSGRVRLRVSLSVSVSASMNVSMSV